jgi:hypothetical protein
MTTVPGRNPTATSSIRHIAVRLVRAANSQPHLERVCYLVGVLLIGAGLAHLAVAAIYPRPWLGPLSWRKPVTFGLSFGTVLISITWVTSYLRLTARTRAVLLTVFCLDCVVEVSGITVQAWRHVPSHFNTTTGINAGIAYALAVGGAVLIATLGTFAVTAVRGRIVEGADRGMRLALRSGFALLLAGLAAGVAMIARGEQLIGQGQRTLAYESAGYLKWFHAITLHAVLVLPALAWWLRARTDRDETQRRNLVALATGAYLLTATTALIIGLTRT